VESGPATSPRCTIFGSAAPRVLLLVIHLEAPLDPSRRFHSGAYGRLHPSALRDNEGKLVAAPDATTQAAGIRPHAPKANGFAECCVRSHAASASIRAAR
jgi:hypothetical protein